MSRNVVRFAYLLLGLMTLVTFGGPFLIGRLLRGGPDPDWPPDRPVEWVAVVGVTGIVVVVFVGLSAIWVANMNHLNEAKAALTAKRAALIDSESESDRGES